ncbi:MAG: hypothetical protein SVV80_12300 [Planctomycetota bacterium]|nr:hypothetical protein [Planctomycetota bacterium]
MADGVWTGSISIPGPSYHVVSAVAHGAHYDEAWLIRMNFLNLPWTSRFLLTAGSSSM